MTKRVPPHDLDAESALLGSMMLSVDAIEAAVVARPSDFYSTAHGIIFRTIQKLHGDGRPVDPITVRDEIESAGLSREAAGPDGNLKKYLLEIQASAPASVNAGQYLAIVLRDARARAALTLSGEIAEGIYSGSTDWQARAEQLGDLSIAAADAAQYSWAPVDVAAILAGTVPVVKPEYLKRHDGEPLLYPGKIHAFNAEPEAGKTWLALVAVAEQLDAGANVLYLDFEDTAVGIISRLQSLGVPDLYIAEQLDYVRPDEAIDARARLTVQKIIHERTPTLAVIDGVAEALALCGLDENSNADVARFLVSLPRFISAAGVTVVMIDHVTKTKETQGRYARGAGHKLAGVDAVYKLESVRPFGRDLEGVSKLVIQKDRHGWIRRLGRHVADFRVDGRDGGDRVLYDLHVPEKTVDAEGHDRPTACMEAISRAVETSKEPVSSSILRKKKEDGGIGFRIATIKAAVSQLVDGKYVVAEDGPRGSLLITSRKPYRADADRDVVTKPKVVPTNVPTEPDLFDDAPWPEDEYGG